MRKLIFFNRVEVLGVEGGLKAFLTCLALFLFQRICGSFLDFLKRGGHM